MEQAQNQLNISMPSYTVMEVLDDSEDEPSGSSFSNSNHNLNTNNYSNFNNKSLSTNKNNLSNFSNKDSLNNINNCSMHTNDNNLPKNANKYLVDDGIKENSLEFSSPPLRMKKRSTFSKIKQPEQKIKTGSNLVWTKQTSLQLPSVKLNILSSDLHHSYFQILIWKIDDQNRRNQEDEQKLEYHAECFISFHKLMSRQPYINYVEDKKFEERQIMVEEKLWMFGRECGSAKFHFQIKNEVYVKQMPVCVRTEKGIEKLAPIFLSSENGQTLSQKQVQKLTQINQQISSKMIQSEKLISEFSMYRQARKLEIQIQQGLYQMKQLLEISTKNNNNNNVRIYQYSTPKQLLVAQQTFLQIGNQIKQYLQNQDHSINEICWLILIALLKRGQFTLAYIGFDEKQRKNIELNKKNKFLERKICVAEKYQEFICQILKLAISALNTEGMDCEKQFAEISCAYAYFRIAQFRNQVLESITNQNDPQITEWRGIQFLLDGDQDFMLIREEMNALSLLFDWEHCFHKCLEKKTNIEEILTVQQSNTWKDRFAKRSIAFFKFIKRWVQYIQSIVPSGKGIQWKYCPGYNRILKAFFIQLKTRQIKLYPDAMKQAALQLLVNEKVISPFITILFNKVNLYDTQTVAQVLQFISQMFVCLQKRNKRVPAIFNFSTFLKGIKIIFQSQASYSVSAGLILLYNHLGIFPLEFQRNISMFLLSKVFFRLFLHWQANVRNIFYHMLIYKILHEYKIFSSAEDKQKSEQRTLKKQYNFQIRSRYEKLIMILKNAENNINKDKNKINKIFEDKQLYLRMKKKFQKRRKKKESTEQPKTNESTEDNFKQNDINQFKTVQKQHSNLYFSNKQSFRVQKSQCKYLVGPFQLPLIFEKANSDRLESNSEQKIVFENIKSFKTEVFNDQNRENNQSFSNDCKKTSTLFHFPNQVKDMTQLDRNNNKIQKKRIKDSIQQTYPNLKFFSKDDKQFLVDIKQLKAEQLHYLKVSMKEFNNILQTYTNNLLNNKFQVPIIKMQQTMIDKKELQPDKIEDW